jgi:pantetheine-phosphate adenylyltransferase
MANDVRAALLTGSMNPFTRGHKYVVEMGLIVFDRVIVGIGHNPDKAADALFTHEQRVEMARGSLAEHGDQVEVRAFTGAAIDFAARVGATAILRGIRNDMDVAYETGMAHANAVMAEVELQRVIPTVYIPCPPALTEISASRVRELIGLRRSIEVLRRYVLPPVAEVIEREIYRAGIGEKGVDND